MRIRSHQHAPSAGKINVTPLIDVVMVLIVFYLIVGKLAADRRVPVRLPTAAQGAVEQGGELVISVSPGKDGPRVDVQGRTLGDKELAELLKGADARERGVQIRADRSLAFADVAPVLRACRDAGLSSVKLATQRPEGR